MTERIEKLENLKNLSKEGLCSYHMEKDACGVGVVANIKGKGLNPFLSRHAPNFFPSVKATIAGPSHGSIKPA